MLKVETNWNSVCIYTNFFVLWYYFVVCHTFLGVDLLIFSEHVNNRYWVADDWSQLCKEVCWSVLLFSYFNFFESCLKFGMLFIRFRSGWHFNCFSLSCYSFTLIRRRVLASVCDYRKNCKSRNKLKVFLKILLRIN